MKYFLSVLFIFILFTSTSCHLLKSSAKEQKESPGGPGVGTASEGSGLTYDDAVVIDATKESDGTTAEYDWLKVHYPGYALIKQTLVYNNNKPYDKMDIRTADGEKKTIYFDISAFFGKF
ncbi:MAG: hypothetical protein HY064_09355 [Bacteroidetes bacterium]|nr:hypothetical protein [Bacteroidota bacterium]